ncbi:MAG: ABC transporter ATP-binding protein, partial [Bacteroidota bacterium]
NLQEEILKIWSANRRTAVLITNDVDEGIFMADRIIPLEPGERSGLGPEYRIKVERPRDKKALNTDPNFRHVRTEILNYLVQLGEAAKLERDDQLTLPDLDPIQPGTRSFGWFRRAS